MGDIYPMAIDFGSIESYNSSRGFGFVSRTFSSPHKKVFFHIRKIKKRHPELAQKLDNEEAGIGANFWYDTATTEKGEQVSKLWLYAGSIPKIYTSELDVVFQVVEDTWRNIELPKPAWLDSVTIELIGIDRRNKLSAKRDSLIDQLRANEEEQRKKAKALREDESRRIAQEHGLSKLKADELHRLLLEVRPLNFRCSKELSQYIVDNQLGYKYPNISGIVRMEESGAQWDFHGGFPTDTYRIICEELSLTNQGTGARAVGFTSFNNAKQNAGVRPSLDIPF